MILDYKEQSSAKRYNLMASCIIPRPIAWISTFNEDKSINIAPFSYFTPLSSNPATMVVSIGHKVNGELKDTLKNLKRDGKCTINIASPEFIDTLHKSSFAYDYEISESEVLHIPMDKIDDTYPPIVHGVPTAFLCDFHSIVALDGKTIPTIVEIKRHYIDDTVVVKEDEKYTIDFEPLARVAREYAKISERLDAPSLIP